MEYRFPKQPMGGTDGEPLPREKVEEKIEFKLIPVPCPIGLDKIHCQNCWFNKEQRCNWPYGQDGSVAK